MLNKIILAFFIFGCWANFIPGVLGFLAFNIWYVLVLFWMIINGLGVLNFLFNKGSHAEKLTEKLTPEVESKWSVYNLVAVISYAMAGCYWISIAFLLTSVLFEMIVLEAKNSGDKKKESK